MVLEGARLISKHFSATPTNCGKSNNLELNFLDSNNSSMNRNAQWSKEMQKVNFTKNLYLRTD